ncbi:MAG: APC family permease [Tepidisphaeraceae bacterium]
MSAISHGGNKPAALSMLSAERPRNVGWKQAAGLLFGDWGTSRLYVLGLAFFFAGPTSLWLIAAMSTLILAVGWAYTQICRIYPDGGGVYTAAKQRSQILAVVGALLLFADYVVTASLSVLDAFHYFGMHDTPTLLAWGSPGLWAIVAIGVIGLFNLMGPKHTGGFAIAAAVGMMVITLLITVGSLPQVHWAQLPGIVGVPHEPVGKLWTQFVSIVLALSGVEAIANLTGVMKKPVPTTARKAIWVVAIEVALFNVLLAIVMVSAHGTFNAEAHRDDMLRFLSGHYIGAWAEHLVGVLGGVLLLSAGNTAITDMIAVQYLMSRDGEVPMVLQRLNRFGVPFVPVIIATTVPIAVLLFSHDLERLAALYAIGVIGAVAINVTLCAMHPRMRGLLRKGGAILLGSVLLVIWVTLAFTKHEALIFVCIVMVCGLIARAVTKWVGARKGPRPSLLRQAIQEQLTEAVLARPRLLLGTYGSLDMAPAAMRYAKEHHATLVICFVREVAIGGSLEHVQKFSIDSDPAAIRTFTRFLDLAHANGVGVIPHYDTADDAAVILAEAAVMHGCREILIGTSRQSLLHQYIKGNFQRRIEAILPDDVHVRVMTRGSIDEPYSAMATA